MNATRWMISAGFVGIVVMGCAQASGDRCTTDTDCKGTRVCTSGVCSDPNTPQDDAGQKTGDDAGSTDPPPNPGTCTDVGTTCTTTEQCCQSGTGIGASGAICISNDNLCHAACKADAECTSGCCAPVEGQSLGVCAAQSACAPTCAAPGAACTVPTDCCQTGTTIPYGATCLSDDYTCHDICYASSECSSGCCIQLQGLSYGACGSASGHSCL